MNILWICNMPLPRVCEAFNIKCSNSGGWLYEEAKSAVSKGNIKLHVCFADRISKKIRIFDDGNMIHYAVPRRVHSFFKYDESMERHFANIIDKVKPDFIHLHGTENTNGLSAMRARPDYTYVVSIQGLISYIAIHESADVPLIYQLPASLGSLIKQNSIISIKRRHTAGGKYEREMISKASYVLGRTTWDRACTYQTNAKAKYIHCKEQLRTVFYKKMWSYDNCQSHRIFYPSSSVALKGFHYMLEALPFILRDYEDTELYVTGDNIINMNYKQKFFKTGYQEYLHKIIKRNNLHNKVHFLGNISDEDMCKQFLKANVFVLGSAIENSPNSLGEAMMLGVPSVAADVGGVSDMIDHCLSGYLYQPSAYYMLAHYVSDIFSNINIATKFSQNAREKARVFQGSVESESILDVYEEIYKYQPKIWIRS